MTEGVKVFLSQLGMSKYYDMFIAKGYDLESDLPHLTAYELEEILMVACQRERANLLAKAHAYRPSREHAVYEWLCSHSLDYYFISFVQSELADLDKIAQLSLPDEELYDELEIVLPGHRRRLERAVEKLRNDQTRNAPAETPVTYGWWGKPKCLPQAKFDFLCVKAFLFSPHEPKNRAAVDFMVDSGSDVSTVQESVLEGLNLELIGPVYSCGVHGGNHCNLYRGRLAVGGQEMDIEVMGSNYDSLGSRVVRHFRHVIDGHRHVWLPGNYQDSLPAILPLKFPHPALTGSTLPSISASNTTPSSSSQIRALPPATSEDGSQGDDTRSSPSARHDSAWIKSQEALPEASHVAPVLSNGDSTIAQTKQGIHSTPVDVDTETFKNKISDAQSGNEDVENIITTAQEGSTQTNSVLDSNSSIHQSENLAIPSTYSQPKNSENLSKPPISQNVNNSLKEPQGLCDFSLKTNTCLVSSAKDSESTKKSENISFEIEGGSKLTSLSDKSLRDKDSEHVQRVSLSHLLPANLRDTDDDVDHHELPDNIGATDSDFKHKHHLFSNVVDTVSIEKNYHSPSEMNLSTVPAGPAGDTTVKTNEELPCLMDTASKKDGDESNRAYSMAYANNFVHASGEVVMLSLEDLDEQNQSFPGEPATIETQGHASDDKGRHAVCEARTDQFHSPHKRIKFNND